MRLWSHVRKPLPKNFSYFPCQASLHEELRIQLSQHELRLNSRTPSLAHHEFFIQSSLDSLSLSFFHCEVKILPTWSIYFIRKLKKTDYFLKSCLTSSGWTDMLSLQSLYYKPALITNTAPTTPNPQFRVCGRLHFP